MGGLNICEAKSCVLSFFFFFFLGGGGVLKTKVALMA